MAPIPNDLYTASLTPTVFAHPSLAVLYASASASQTGTLACDTCPNIKTTGSGSGYWEQATPPGPTITVTLAPSETQVTSGLVSTPDQSFWSCHVWKRSDTEYPSRYGSDAPTDLVGNRPPPQIGDQKTGGLSTGAWIGVGIAAVFAASVAGGLAMCHETIPLQAISRIPDSTSRGSRIISPSHAYRAYCQPQNLPADPVYHPKYPMLSNLSLGSTPFISPSQLEALRTTTT